VSRQLGTTHKEEMPSHDDPVAMIEYCTIDSKSTCEIWMKVDGARKMDCMSSAFRSCTLDTMMYSTGVMTSCLVSSNLLSRSMHMDSSKCSTVLEFRGGFVMDPFVGTYFNVMMADFNSMYPTIMIGCNISVETVRWRCATDDETDGDVAVMDNGNVTCTIGREAIWFDRTSRGVMCGILEELIRVRSKYKKGKFADPEFSFALKVATNSMFGAIGYVNSPMYSPRASACVTSIGRYCLMNLMSRLTNRGFHVIYGDTDSCFVSANDVCPDAESFKETCEEECTTMRKVSSLSTMTLSYDQFDSVVLRTKKKYIMNTGGVLVPKGVSIVRRDREKIVNTKIMDVCKTVLTIRDPIAAAREVTSLMNSHRLSLSSGRSLVSQCSMMVRRRGSMYYEYVGVDTFGDAKVCSLIVDNTSSDVIVSYHVPTLLRKYSDGVDEIIRASNLGSIQLALSHMEQMRAELYNEVL
jgi:hypothetical protein